MKEMIDYCCLMLNLCNVVARRCVVTYVVEVRLLAMICSCVNVLLRFEVDVKISKCFYFPKSSCAPPRRPPKQATTNMKAEHKQRNNQRNARYHTAATSVLSGTW